MLQIASRVEGKLQIMSLTGEVDEGTCTRLAEALEAGSKSLASHVLLDLHDLAYINRTGQRIILKHLSLLHQMGRKLIVCQTRQAVHYAFSETGLDKVMTILPTIQAAKAFIRSHT